MSEDDDQYTQDLENEIDDLREQVDSLNTECDYLQTMLDDACSERDQLLALCNKHGITLDGLGYAGSV